MTKLLLPAPSNEYVKAISYPQRNLDSIFSTLLELKEMSELFGGLRDKAIGRLALWEELQARYIELMGRIVTSEGDITAIEAELVLINAEIDALWLNIATTTDILTGTNNTRFATSAAIAALWGRGSDIVDASVVGGVLTLGDGEYFYCTATAASTISDIDWVVPKDGRGAWVFFNGGSPGPTLVHSGSFVLPGATNIITQFQDKAYFVQHAGNGVFCLYFQRADGSAIIPATTTEVLTGVQSTKHVTADALAALWERGSDLAISAGVITLPEGGFFKVTSGSGPVTSITWSTLKDGRRALLHFSGISVTLTHSAALICPGSVDLVVAAGTFVEVVKQDGVAIAKVINVMHLDGSTGAGSASTTEVLTGTETRKSITPDALAALWEANAVAVAPAATVTFGEGGYFILSGTPTTISAFAFSVAKNGRRVMVRCAVAAAGTTIVPGASLTTPGNGTITLNASDIFEVLLDGGVYRVVNVVLGDGTNTVIRASTTDVLTGTNTTRPVTPDALAALWEVGAAVTTAAATIIGEGGYFSISGAGTITSFDYATPSRNGRRFSCRFTTAGIVITNSANLFLFGANIITQAGDMAVFVQAANGTPDVFVLISYMRADGSPIRGWASTTDVLSGIDTTKTVTADVLAALWEKGAATHAAGVLSIGDGGYVLWDMTSAGSITDIDFSTASRDGRRAWVYVIGAPGATLVHNATSLVLPGNNNIPLSPGDRFLVAQNLSDNAFVLDYVRADGKSIVAHTASETPSTATGDVAATNVQAAIAELASEKAALAGATFTGAVNIDRRAASAVAALTMYGGANPPAISDVLASYDVRGRDSGGTDVAYTVLYTRVRANTAGAHSGFFLFRNWRAGVARDPLNIEDGVIVGAPSGGDKGLGTINAVAVYDDNVLLTCMALEEGFRATGKFTEADIARWDTKVPNTVIPAIDEFVEVEPAKDDKPAVMERITAPGQVIKNEHHTARVFKKLVDEGLDLRSAKSFVEHLDKKRSIPGMPSMDEWVHNKISSGEMISRLWLSAEIMSLSLVDIESRLATLEAKLSLSDVTIPPT